MRPGWWPANLDLWPTTGSESYSVRSQYYDSRGFWAPSWYKYCFIFVSTANRFQYPAIPYWFHTNDECPGFLLDRELLIYMNYYFIISQSQRDCDRFPSISHSKRFPQLRLYSIIKWLTDYVTLIRSNCPGKTLLPSSRTSYVTSNTLNAHSLHDYFKIFMIIDQIIISWTFFSTPRITSAVTPACNSGVLDTRTVKLEEDHLQRCCIKLFVAKKYLYLLIFMRRLAACLCGR